MCERDIDQKILFQQYAELGKKITAPVENSPEQTRLNAEMWELITKKGIWKLPMPKNNGDKFSWHACYIAIEGLASTYSNLEFLTALLTQMSALFLILKYGSEAHKRKYLPLLSKGKKVFLFISQAVDKLIYYEYWLNKQNNKLLNIENAELVIYTHKVKNNISFYIGNKKIDFFKKIKMNEILNLDKNILIPIEQGTHAICDLINFERLLYGIVATKFAFPVHEKLNKCLQKKSTTLTDRIIKRVYKETKENLKIAESLLLIDL